MGKFLSASQYYRRQEERQEWFPTDAIVIFSVEFRKQAKVQGRFGRLSAFIGLPYAESTFEAQSKSTGRVPDGLEPRTYTTLQ